MLGLAPQPGRQTAGVPPRLGDLPLARRDVERLRQILGLQRRLRDLGASPRAKRALTHRSIFREALTWLELHGSAPDVDELVSLLAGFHPRDQITVAEIGAVIGTHGGPRVIGVTYTVPG